MQEGETQNGDARATEKANRKQYGGIPAKAFFIPIVVVLAILNIVIIGLMFSMFSQSSRMAQITSDSSVYASDATSLIASTSLLSETSSTYVLMPVTKEGAPNVGPLGAYASELQQVDHRGASVLSRFQDYRVSEDVLADITEAAEAADALVALQGRALALVSAVYSLPDSPLLEGFELPELSAEDAALPADKKIELAQSIVLGNEWGTSKSTVSSKTNEAVGKIRAATGQQTASASATIGLLRALLLGFAIAIVVILAVSFFLLYRWLISPLGWFSKLIERGDPLEEKGGMREIRLLAGTYNGLLHRRNTLEAILREAAETDTLTGLPNRYSLQQDLLDAAGEGYSLAVFLFDVDNLKLTNDTLGHAAGDDLIRRAANCISGCFGESKGGKCYRFGGDEFAAVVPDLDENVIPALGKDFESAQKSNDVFISWGYAYTREIGETSLRALMADADQRMYQMKQKVHLYGHRRAG